LSDLAKRTADGRAAVLRHLESLTRLFDSDREVLGRALGPVGSHPAGHELIPLDALLDAPVFLLSGWVSRSVSLPDGRRQILDFYIAGDLVGHCSRPTSRAKASYQCLTNVVCAGATELIARTHDQPQRFPGLSAAWRAIEDEIEQRLIDQIIRTGRMLAHERMVHLIGDLSRRHRRAGLGSGDGFVIPLTQEMLGEAVGLSTVHVNRVLQQMRRERIIRTALGRLEILNPTLVESAIERPH
jgi:CRP-like cAMP-binding protein